MIELAKVREIVEALELDLQGYTVVTEAASGNYGVTPLIPLLAGARVVAYAADSGYGSQEDVYESTRRHASELCLQEKLELPESWEQVDLSRTDIITNSGHLRPLDESKLSRLKPGAVIALMYEDWEFRDEDIDLDVSNALNLPIVATNERHPDIGVFDYLGEMAVKLVHDSGHSFAGKHYLLLCNNAFGPFLAKTMAPLCKALGVIVPPEHKTRYAAISGARCLAPFPTIDIPAEFEATAGVILAAHPFKKTWIGATAPIATHELKRACPDAILYRFAGHASEEDMAAEGLAYYPSKVDAGHMGILPSDLGVEPILRLQAGSFKAAECYLRARTFMFNGHAIGSLLNC